MIYTDTRDNNIKVDLKTAVMGGMNEKTGGLYIPVEFPKLDSSLLNKDPSTISKEVRKHRIRQEGQAIHVGYNHCARKYNCHRHNLCSSTCRKTRNQYD